MHCVSQLESLPHAVIESSKNIVQKRSNGIVDFKICRRARLTYELLKVSGSCACSETLRVVNCSCRDYALCSWSIAIQSVLPTISSSFHCLFMLCPVGSSVFSPISAFLSSLGEPCCSFLISGCCTACCTACLWITFRISFPSSFSPTVICNPSCP